MPLDVENLYTKYGPMVLRRCRQLLIDEESALDAMQDTFVKVLRYRNSLNATYPSGLLYRIATNVCLNIIRRRKKTADFPCEEMIATIAAVDDVEEKVIQRNLINRIFSKEKVSTKVIAVLHYIDGMTLKEVAEEVGLSVSGVRKRLTLLKKRARIFNDEIQG